MWFWIFCLVCSVLLALVVIWEVRTRRRLNARVLVDPERASPAPHVKGASELPRVIPYSDPLLAAGRVVWQVLSGRGEELRSFTHMHERFMQVEQSPGSPGMVASTFMGKTIITCWHREHAEQLLGKGSEKHFSKVAGGFSPEFDAISRKSIFLVEGEEWTNQRKVISPAFRFDHVSTLTPYFNRVATNLISRWAVHAKRDTAVEVSECLSQATMDALGLGAFGFDFNSLGDNEKREGLAYQRVMRELTNPLRLMQWYAKLPLQSNKEFRQAVADYVDFLEGIIRTKRAQACTEDSKMDLLDVMVRAVDAKSGYRLSDAELVHNVNIFFLAGHETTASALAFAFHMLAEHPEVQEKLYREVMEHVGDGEPDYDAIKQMEYMRWFFSETLRLYGPGAAVVRAARHSMEFGGYHIEKDDWVMLFSYTMHRLPQYWDDPEAFRPERFAPEQHRGRMFSYMPFSVGPRQCIGNNFAMLEMRVLLTRALQHFRFVRDDRAKVPFGLETRVVMGVRSGHTLRVQER